MYLKKRNSQGAKQQRSIWPCFWQQHCSNTWNETLTNNKKKTCSISLFWAAARIHHVPDLGLLASSLWACLEIAGWWLAMAAVTGMFPTHWSDFPWLQTSSLQTCPTTQIAGWPSHHCRHSSFLLVWVPRDSDPLGSPCGASHGCCFLTEPRCQAVSKHYWVFEHQEMHMGTFIAGDATDFLELLVTCYEPNNPPSSFNSVLKVHFLYIFFSPIWPCTLLLCVCLKVF